MLLALRSLFETAPPAHATAAQSSAGVTQFAAAVATVTLSGAAICQTPNGLGQGVVGCSAGAASALNIAGFSCQGSVAAGGLAQNILIGAGAAASASALVHGVAGAGLASATQQAQATVPVASPEVAILRGAAARANLFAIAKSHKIQVRASRANIAALAPRAALTGRASLWRMVA